MGFFIFRRVLLVIPVMLGVSIAAFLMSHLIPGDPVSVMLGETATADDVERLREELGFNDPLLVQYLRYIGGVLQGVLGTSIRSGQPVLDEIVERIPSTAALRACANRERLMAFGPAERPSDSASSLRAGGGEQ